jgi:hypothetical protein
MIALIVSCMTLGTPPRVRVYRGFETCNFLL